MTENCILCLEELKISEPPLICGHRFHIECVKKHFKPECPVCRRIINIDVSGTKPELYLPFDPESMSDISQRNDFFDGYDIYGNYFQQVVYFDNQDMMDIVQEDDEEDEENKMGDNWNYEDV